NFRNWETEFTCKDGTRKIISWSTISDLAPIPGWFSWGIGVDVTERHTVEEERRDLEGRVQNLQRIESLGVMAGGIAHDFNNLLMGILGNAELARLDLPENAPTHEYLKDIEEASHSAAELCKQMLAFSGKGKFVIETVNLNNLLMQIDPIIRSLLSKNITFDLHCSDVPLYIEADSTQIRQLVMNLATNAVEAIDNGEGKISIVTGLMYCSDEYLNETLIQVSLQEGDYAFIEVSDDGCGIENKVMQKIFDPFFSTKFIGRGLGLPVVLGIVRGHNGTLRVYSERDHGTTVKALFPLSTKRPEVRLSGDGVIESWDTKGTVLVVDDDETVRNVAGRMLQKAGLDVIFASSGIEAVEKYQKERESIHCVLLDLTMPEMSGEDVFKKLHSIDPNVKVVLSSGYNEQDVSSRISINGFAGFIQKPYQSRKLYQILQSVITNQETN
ncbi:response regulator, partial [bacterium]|nr:response regulator [bacterium]